MKIYWFVILAALAGVVWLFCPFTARAAAALTSRNLTIIPMPREVTLQSGTFPVSELTAIALTAPDNQAQNKEAVRVAEMLREYLEKDCAIKAQLLIAPTKSAAIQLELREMKDLGAEGYCLIVDPAGVHIQAGNPAGLFYGFQTLRQMLCGAVEKQLPFVQIKDIPCYSWRGMHLDVSRHFYPKEAVEKYLDYMAAYKLNTFHWHLVDGPGWRIQIKKYPKLTEIGAWRKDKTAQPWNWRATEIGNGKQPDSYGGFYTQEDIREIVQYAQDRFITIVPEIEMPGHSYAALMAYPELACVGSNIKSDGLKGQDTFCASNEMTYAMLEDVLDEILPLFPSTFIHVGGDEVSPVAWMACPLCRKLAAQITAEKIPGEPPGYRGIQSRFMARIGKYLATKGRRMIAWDEVLDGVLPKDAAIMVWRDANTAKVATACGISVVMNPANHCYFDNAQTGPSAVTLEQVYALDPVAGIPDQQKHFVLGVQADVWTENIQTLPKVEYMIFPRLCALAEVAWSPPEKHNFSDFVARVMVQETAWKNHGINFRPVK